MARLWGGGAVAFMLAALALAGCGDTNGGTSSATVPSLTTTTAPPAPDFDGDAALGFVKGFALKSDGSPRFRIPGTEGQAEGAEYLWAAMDLPGWTRYSQNLTGADYVGLDRSIIAHYTVPDAGNDPPGGSPPRGCTPAESEAVPALPFRNLLAVRDGEPETPLVLVAAHWDSQMHSDFDKDPAKRDDPDPGANDGASGVGLLLQLMRELDGVDLPFRMGVLFLDGEDGFFDCYPLAGSLYYAQHPPLDAAGASLLPDRFILLDMVGDPGARYVREGDSTKSDKALVDLLWRHGRALGGEVAFTNQAKSISDDHLSFIQQGVPSVDIIDAGRPTTFPPQWDTTEDTVEKLSPDMLALVGKTILASLQDPEFVAKWPGLPGAGP